MLSKVYDKRKILLCITFFIYLIGVFSLTFIVRETMVLRTPENRGVILTPLREFNAMLHQPNHVFWLKQIFLNILLFVPFGCLLPLVSKLFRNPLFTVFLGFLFSGLIEMMQYITGRGLTEVDDIITNTLGTAVGVALYFIFRVLINQFSKSDY